MWRVVRERVVEKSPVRENRPPGSVRGAPDNRRPYRDPSTKLRRCLKLTLDSSSEYKGQ